MAETVSLNEMIAQIRAWQRETDNFRNDSWTQDAYKAKIRELFDHMAPIINNLDPAAFEDAFKKVQDNKEEKS